MRANRLFKARKDVVDLLLRQGRLADIQLLNFYNMELSRECARKAAAATATATKPESTVTKPAETASASAATTTTTATASAQADPSAAAAAAAQISAAETAASRTNKGPLPAIDTVAALAALEVTRTTRKAAHDRFSQQLTRVRQSAVEKGPLEWIGEAYGTDTWTSSCLSKHSTKGHRVSPGSAQLKLRGVSLVSGGPGSKPTSARVVVNLAEKADVSADQKTTKAGPHSEVVATVKLEQPGVKSTVVNGVMRLEFTDAEATIQADGLRPSQMASHQHVMNAAAYSGMLAKLEEICSLHATHAVRYDGLLVRNPAVQMRLSQLACFRFAIDSLTSYVLGDGEIDAEDERRLLDKAREGVREARGPTQDGERADGGSTVLPNPTDVEKANAAALRVVRKYNNLDIPLLESMVLNMYAETALMDGLDGAWALVRDTTLTNSVPHRSNAAKMIDYPYIQSLFEAPKYALTSNDGSLELQAQEFLAPLLRDAPRLGSAGGSANPLRAVAEWANNLVGLSSGGQVRLAAPHVNLKVAAAALETDVATLLRLVREQNDMKDPTFITGIGLYLSEVFANLAVLYRCTAALNYDEEGKGHREWLLTEAFCASSKVRRERIVNDLVTAKAAAKVLSKAADLDNYCTHPIELMNTAPRKAAADKAAKKGQSGAKADA